MAYCDLADIEKRYPSLMLATLTDDSGGAGLDNAKLTTAIDEAESIINSYARSRYAVPFTTVPRLIKKVAIDLTLYGLFQLKYDVEMPDAMRARYTDSIKTLEAIQSGRVNLEDVSATEEIVPTIVQSNKSATDRMFPATVLNRW